MYITIDESRFQQSSSVWDNIGIQVDCLAPSKYHTLKSDYLSYSGVNQWQENESLYKLNTALNRTIFQFDEIINACKDLEDVIIAPATETSKLKTRLMTITSDPDFNLYLISGGGIINLGNDAVQEALTFFTDEEVIAIKKQVAGLTIA